MRRVTARVSQAFPSFLHSDADGTGRADWRVGLAGRHPIWRTLTSGSTQHTRSSVGPVFSAPVHPLRQDTSSACPPLESSKSSKGGASRPTTTTSSRRSRAATPLHGDDRVERAAERGHGRSYRLKSVECRGPGRLTGDCERRSGGQTSDSTRAALSLTAPAALTFRLFPLSRVSYTRHVSFARQEST